MSFFIGVDIGGTFTDAWAVSDNGVTAIAKTSSTPPNFEEGFLNSLKELASQFETTTADLLADTLFLAHGTTVATNIMVQRAGAEVGLIVTKGHRDALKMMRATGRTAGLSPELLADTKATDKPSPLVDRSAIVEVNERIDVDGDIVVPLAEEEIRTAIQFFQERGIESIGIALLWSFTNPIHEQTIEAILRQELPHVFLSSSTSLSPQIGEYERTAAVAINCYVGPETASYLRRLQAELVDLGYQRPLFLTHCSGGVMEVSEAAECPIKLFQSGPVSGINAAAKVPDIGNQVIATDMGGTSFDVGLVVDGRPLSRKSTIVDRYEYQLATVDIQSIGSGGGSIAWFDESQGALRVGPRSAGARPGPAAYGRGGSQPTVTDADLLLGYLNPTYFLGGAMQLDAKAAARAMERLSDRMGMSVTETAAGIIEIVDKQMGDLIRRLTLGKGYDPRDFSLLAYGGAGPVHAAGFAQDIGVREVIIPGSAASSVWSAFGAATSDLVQVIERGCLFATPLPVRDVRATIEEMRQELDRRLGKDRYSVTWTADMHYTTQISELEVVLSDIYDADFGASTVGRFQDLYERTYGRGSGFREVAVEITTLRARAQQGLGQPKTVWDQANGSTIKGHRKVYWPEMQDYVDTPIYSSVNERASGPLVVELVDTSIVVHPGQSIRSDSSGNLVLNLVGE